MWVGSGVFAKSSIFILNNFKDDERQVDALCGWDLECLHNYLFLSLTILRMMKGRWMLYVGGIWGIGLLAKYCPCNSITQPVSTQREHHPCKKQTSQELRKLPCTNYMENQV